MREHLPFWMAEASTFVFLHHLANSKDFSCSLEQIFMHQPHSGSAMKP